MLPMCVIAAWEGRVPVMTADIQPLPTLSAWKQECSLCHHSGKFVIWSLGMTETTSDEKQSKNSQKNLRDYLKLSEWFITVTPVKSGVTWR